MLKQSALALALPLAAGWEARATPAQAGIRAKDAVWLCDGYAGRQDNAGGGRWLFPEIWQRTAATSAWWTRLEATPLRPQPGAQLRRQEASIAWLHRMHACVPHSPWRAVAAPATGLANISCVGNCAR